MSFNIRTLAAAAAFLVIAGPSFAHGYKVGTIEIGHPWSRATPAGAQVAGGYFVLKNTGTEPDRLLSATSEISGGAEIHEMTVKDGIMTMRPMPEGVEIPPGGEVAFTPGGLHLMLVQLKRQLVEGEKVPGTLTFEKGGTVKVEFAVDSIGAKGKAPEAGHDHGGETEKHTGH